MSAAASRPPIPDAQRAAALALSSLPGVGPVRWAALLQAHGDAHRALAAAAPDEGVRRAALERAAEWLLRAAHARLTLLLRGDPAYPGAFEALRDPPLALWLRGDRALLDTGTRVSIVGTRAPSTYGARAARALATAVARAGGVVVSGMARGIDGIAHEAALDAGAPSIAVLATGADVPYPAGHRALHRRLGEQGLVLSETPPGERGTAGAFPQRNRLIAALAPVTLVVEAGQKSGALITASHALELGRTVAAVPGPIDLASTLGSNALLRDGAQLITGPDDLLTLLGLRSRTADAARPASEPPPGLTDDERAVWLALADPLPDPEMLARRSALPARRCIAALGTLELAGLVETHWNGTIARR